MTESTGWAERLVTYTGRVVNRHPAKASLVALVGGLGWLLHDRPEFFPVVATAITTTTTALTPGSIAFSLVLMGAAIIRQDMMVREERRRGQACEDRYNKLILNHDLIEERCNRAEARCDTLSKQIEKMFRKMKTLDSRHRKLLIEGKSPSKTS